MQIQFSILVLASILVLSIAGTQIVFAADVISVTHNQVTISTNLDVSPTLGNDGISDFVVYTSVDALGNGKIECQRLTATGAPDGIHVVISDGTTDDRLNDVYGNKIIYTAFESPGVLGKVMLYDLATGTRTALTIAESIQEARIHGDNVAWIQGAIGSTQVKLLDWTTIGSGGVPITLGAVGSTSVEIDSRFVVWSESSGGQLDVTAYDIGTGFTFPVAATASFDESQPSTYGDWVTWQFDSAVGGTGVAAMNLDTFGSHVVVEDGANNILPSINGDFISYESDVAGNYDVYLHRLSDSQTFQATSSAADQVLNNVFSNLVAYSDQGDPAAPQPDIYVTHFSLAPADPCADAGGDIDADGVCGDVDNCSVANAGQADSDSDGLGDACDVCPADPDNDADADGVCGDVDNCPATSNEDQADVDMDGIGDLCDAVTFEGCGAGFWKNPKHIDEWDQTGITPSDPSVLIFVFSQGFFSDPIPAPQQILDLQGGTAIEKLAKEFLVAALNFLHPDIDYGLDENQIAIIVTNAFQTNDPEEILDAKDQLEHYNNMVCPLE